MTYILLAILLLAILYIFSTHCKRKHGAVQKLCGWSYAHRGLHGDGAPENSLKAFQLAVERGYGSELDVHLLADGNLAVIHDSVLKRTTGLDGRIEDLTVEQLSTCFLEGTTETIPTLEQVLHLYNGRAPLIVELKSVGNNIDKLCSVACKVLDQYQGLFCIESFDPRCVAWLRKHRPDIIRGQLTENFFASKTSKLPWYIKFVMRHQMLNFTTVPDFIAYRYQDRKTFSNFLCRKLWNVQFVAWTLQTKSDYDLAVAEGWIPIFENFEP